MKNLFEFSYSLERITNKDGSESNYSTVFGENGNVINVASNSYTVVRTEDVSILAQAFIEKGYKVTPYSYKSGQIIGLNIDFGTKPSVVGDSTYRLVLNIPNNGHGAGKLSVHQRRLICDNGMVRTTLDHEEKNLKIVHNIDYNKSLELVKQSVVFFEKMLEDMIKVEEQLNAEEFTDSKFRYALNKWFWEQEVPEGQKNGMTLNQFRKSLSEDISEYKWSSRYEQLMAARAREMEHNKELGLKLSRYTVLAAVTNYLTRRTEKSKTKAPREILDIRTARKTDYMLV